MSAAILSRKYSLFCSLFHSCSMGSRLLFPVMAIIVLFFLQDFVSSHGHRRHRLPAGEREMNMVFYLHDNLSGRKVTSVPVAGLHGSSSNAGNFGTLVVTSDVITKRSNVNTNPESDSDNIVGRVQGTYVNTNPVTGLDFFMSFTLIFQNMEYNSSTLEIQGTDRFDQPQCEYAVVGGTGKFRFARGYAVVTTESTSAPNAVLKFNTTFLVPS